MSEPGGRRAARARLYAVLPVVLLWLLGSGALRAQTVADPYSATVKVEASAANAVEARRLARQAGEAKALAVVVSQLAGPGSGAPSLPKLGHSAITNLVRNFEVAHERMSAVSYRADYTFHFYPDKVNKLLAEAGVSAPPATASGNPVSTGEEADTQGAGLAAGDIVVLPVYRDGGRAVLWDDPNPWRQAWSQVSGGAGAARLIVPLGGARDVAAIGARRAEDGDARAISAIARHEGSHEVVVALARIRHALGEGGDGDGGVLQVTLTLYRDGQPVASHEIALARNPGEDRAAFLARAVMHSANAISGGSEVQRRVRTLAAVVPIHALSDWIAVRERLASLPAIRAIEVLSLNRAQARVRLSYLGRTDRLRDALAGVDLVLDGGGPVWRLHPAGTADLP